MKKILFFVAAIATLIGCRPDEALSLADSFRLSLNTDIFNYRYNLLVIDENGAIQQSGVKVSLIGRDASKIYTEFGDQDFELNAAGELTFTVNPNTEPTEAYPLVFDIVIRKDNYETVTLPVTISNGEFNLSEVATIVSYQSLQSDYDIDIIPATANNGALVGSSVLGKGNSNVNVLSKINIDSVYYDANPVSIVLEDGATFYYYFDEQYQIPSVPREVLKIIDTSGTVNGVPITTVRDSTIYGDTIWETRTRKVRKEYSGDEIGIWTRFTNLRLPSTANNAGNSGRTVKTLYSGTGLTAAMVPVSATVVPTYFVGFKGEVDGEDGPQTVELYAQPGSVLYSMVVDPTAINPTTGNAWAEGDSLEVGQRSYYGNGLSNERITRRLEIQKASNGELRIQSNVRFTLGGHYKLMDFSAPYNINILLGSTAPDTSIVPDLENLRYAYLVEAILNDGKKVYLERVGSYFSALRHIRSEVSAMENVDVSGLLGSSWLPEEVQVSGTLYSQSPVAEFKVYTLAAYFDKQLRFWNQYTFGGDGSVPLFQPEFSDDNNYLARTGYNVKVVCASTPDSTTLFPSASASSEIGGSKSFARLRDGRWATRGISIGDTLGITINYKNWTLDTAFVVEKPNTAVEYVDQTGLDVCDL